MTEKEFNDLVSCRFPYQEPERWKALIDRAQCISTNAMFIALYEICRPPRGALVLPEKQREMLAYWRARIDHPLAETIAYCARSMIDGKLLPVDRIMQIMSMISGHVGQYGALSIAYFSCDDVHATIEPHYQKIIADWNAASA